MANWSVEILKQIVAGELGALPSDMRARFQRIIGLIEAHGLERVGEPHVKHLEAKLWEMRMTGRDGIARAIYIAATGRRVVVQRAFEKKTQKTPRSEIAMAHDRAKEVE